MGQLTGSALEVRVLWGSSHNWPAGREYSGPCYANALWLLLEGEAQVWSGEQCWTVSKGDALLWPKDRPRRILTPQGASWLSLGFSVTATGQTDIFSVLPLPAKRHLEAKDSHFLYGWLKDIVEIRDTLTHATPEHLKVAKYFESVDTLAALPSYDQWINQIVEERPAHFDVIEEGLARAIIGWCWELWGTSDLEHTIHYQSPQWLQNTLEKIRQQPDISVHELSHITGFSPAQFRRLFHQEMGQSPRDYLQRQRLEYARHLLETTDLSISGVAAKTGFASVPHFVQLWKRTSGLSPLQYRQSSKSSRI